MSKLQRTTLYLGRSIDNGRHHPRGHVTTDELTAFYRETVAPIFPGFTVQHAQDYWEGEAEPVALLTIAHSGRDRAVQLIARAYCERFRQSAVLSETVLAFVHLETRSGKVAL